MNAHAGRLITGGIESYATAFPVRLFEVTSKPQMPRLWIKVAHARISDLKLILETEPGVMLVRDYEV